MNIDGEYPAYCFNEVCMLLLQHMEDGKKLQFPNSNAMKKHYRSLSDYYSDMGVDVNGL